MLHLYYIKISAKNQMVNNTIHYPLRYIILPIYTTLHSSGFLSPRIALNTARRTPILSEGTYTMVQTTGLIHVAYRHPFGILKNGQSASAMLYWRSVLMLIFTDTWLVTTNLASSLHFARIRLVISFSFLTYPRQTKSSVLISSIRFHFGVITLSPVVIEDILNHPSRLLYSMCKIHFFICLILSFFVFLFPVFH